MKQKQNILISNHNITMVKNEKYVTFASKINT